ncbi:MAG TPA: S1 RNA-binding domain-containing protein [Patescibacteria group bacterium]|nr:S1 RNA-binding domain-containing protein [Patescibacteria group bacterium]
MSTKTQNDEIKSSELGKLIDQEDFLYIPSVGDTITGTVVSASKNEVRIDINGIHIGVVRGRELYNEAPEYGDLEPGAEVQATVVEEENEKGEMELSFRYAGQKKAWEHLHELKKEGTIIKADIIDANKGGLLVRVGHVKGFLPVSQLTPEHYPRVPGGDKNKILEQLKEYVGKSFDTKVIDANEEDEKLIVSEKEAWEEVQHNIISSYKTGDNVEGKITAITDFGVFMEFGEKLEGLIHISELAWQRIDNPKSIVKIGEHVKAEIINIEGSKIFLSMKKLKADPWQNVHERYQVGQIVKGKVLKINPFGLFIELDKEIHGLAHISELSEKPVSNVEEIAKPGDTLDFKIISIEPKDHRLGLSIKAMKKDSSEPLEPKSSEPKSEVSSESPSDTSHPSETETTTPTDEKEKQV